MGEPHRRIACQAARDTADRHGQPNALDAQEVALPRPSTEFPRAAAWLQRAIDDGKLSDAVFGVADSSGVLQLRGFGADPDSRFALFSITKPLVGLVTLQLIEEGLLSPDTPLSSALAGVDRNRGGVIRLRHLLTHSAGIHDPALDDPTPLRAALTNAGQDFTPGSALRYSSIAFEGVAALAESVSGTDLADLLLQIDPDLAFDRPEHAVIGGERVGLDPTVVNENRHPGAGLTSRAATLLTVGSSLLRTLKTSHPGIVTEPTLRSSLRPRTTGLPELIGGPMNRTYGLSWHLRKGSTNLLDDDVFGHAGASGTQWWFYLRRDVVMVMLTNVLDLPGIGVDVDQLNNAFVTDLERA